MTPSQIKAINSSKTMSALIAAQRSCGETICGKTVRQNEVMNWLEIQIRTEADAYSWKVTPRGRIVEEHVAGMAR